MVAWIGGIWLMAMILAVGLASAAGRSDDHADAIARELGFDLSDLDAREAA